MLNQIISALTHHHRVIVECSPVWPHRHHRRPLSMANDDVDATKTTHTRDWRALDPPASTPQRMLPIMHVLSTSDVHSWCTRGAEVQCLRFGAGESVFVCLPPRLCAGHRHHRPSEPMPNDAFGHKTQARETKRRAI